MVTAFATVHLQNGIWITNGGYEYDGVSLPTRPSLSEPL
jgi:hypothetical protein